MRRQEMEEEDMSIEEVYNNDACSSINGQYSLVGCISFLS